MRRGRLWRQIAAVCGVAICLMSLLVAVTPRAVQGQQPAPATRDAIILLDITASMRGQGDDPKARDIWDQVVAKVGEQLDQLAVGTSLTIIPFANGPRYSQIWPK